MYIWDNTLSAIHEKQYFLVDKSSTATEEKVAEPAQMDACDPEASYKTGFIAGVMQRYTYL